MLTSYSADWDRPHKPGPSDDWQESDCYWFYDAKVGVGGYHRIGQFPNRGTGQVLAFAFHIGGKRFRQMAEFTGNTLARTATGQQVGSHRVEPGATGEMHYAWREEGCEAQLRFFDPFYTPRSWTEKEHDDAGAAAVASSMNTDGHLEVAGRIAGTVTIDGETYQIDALAHRDRSWGNRDYGIAHQHRMATGTIGPELSWATYIMHLDNGLVAKAGFVARHGKTCDISDIRLLTELDWDGLTVSGMRTAFVLKDGSKVTLSGPAVEATAFETGGWLLSSHAFIALQNGGFSILDVTNRPSKGRYIPGPTEATQICMVDGVGSAGQFAALQW